MIIQITNGRRSTFWYKGKLTSEGFTIIKKTSRTCSWQKSVDPLDKKYIKWCKSYCRRRHIQYQEINEKYTRSSDYRTQYINHDKGYHGIYFCMYCARPLTMKQMTVDHIIPVDKASKKKWLQKILEKRNIQNINDIRNLGPACKRCNSVKGNRITLYWLLLAWLGNIRYAWVVRWAFRIILLSIIIVKILM